MADDELTREGLRQLFTRTNLTDEEAILVCAVRFLLALDAAGVPLPVAEKDAVMRGVARYMEHADG